MTIENSSLTNAFDLSAHNIKLQVHHIIPQTLCDDLDGLRNLLQATGFDIDGVENGLPLPTNDDDALRLGSSKHFGNHVSDYSDG